MDLQIPLNLTQELILQIARTLNMEVPIGVSMDILVPQNYEMNLVMSDSEL